MAELWDLIRKRRNQACVLFVLLGLASPAIADGAEDWPEEAREALDAYRRGDFAAADRLCDELTAVGRNPGLAVEAALIRAMCLLHGPSRNDRLDGRARLAQLAAERPEFEARPECNLAYGIAATALSETAAALDNLDRAVRGFRALRQPEREAAALAALAEAWAVHGEWELTDPRFAAPVRPMRSEAHALRLRRIAELREQAAKITDAPRAAAEIDLVLGRLQIADDATRAAGLTLLNSLADRNPRDAIAGRAALTLAGEHEARGDWAAAVAAYERAASTPDARVALVARERIDALRQPRIELNPPRVAAPNEPVPLGLRVRGVTAVQVEVRRIDLHAWLEKHRGRFNEAQLDVTGSVVLAERVAPSVASPLEWYDANAVGDTLRPRLAPGAYVVSANAADSADVAGVRRLLLVSRLRAGLGVGSRDAAVWAVDGASQSSPESARASFWMHHSFVPKRVALQRGAAVFALPNEARVLRDRRWTCLVQDGEHLALCEGRVPEPAASAAPFATLIASAGELRVGDTLRLCGVLAASAPPRGGSASILTVEILDPLERVLYRTECALSNAGTFVADIPITREVAAATPRVRVRRGGQTIELHGGRFGLNVRRPDQSPLVATVRLPPRIPPEAPMLMGQVVASYPWGTPASAAPVALSFQGANLPAAAAGDAGSVSQPLVRRDRLDAAGRLQFALPLADLKLEGDALAVRIGAIVRGPDERPVFASAESSAAAEALQSWLLTASPQPRAGEPLHFVLGWFDPAEELIDTPRVRVRDAGGTELDLSVYSAAGELRTEVWRPERSGACTATLMLPTARGVVNRELPFLVSDADPGACPPPQVRATLLRSAAGDEVEIVLTGRTTQMLAAVVEGENPLAAATIAPFAGESQMRLSLPAGGAALGRLWVRCVSAGASSVPAEVVVPVDPPPESALQLELPSGPLAFDADGFCALRVRCTAGGAAARDAVVIARMIPAADSVRIPWLPGVGRDSWEQRHASARLFSDLGTQDGGGSNAPEAAPARAAAAEEDAVLTAGVAVWADIASCIDGEALFRVPSPPTPGRYRILLLARNASEQHAISELVVAAEGGCAVSVDLPERMAVGDRTVGVIIVENPRSKPEDVRVQVSLSDGLRREGVTAHRSGRPQEVVETPDGMRLTVPPYSQVSLNVAIEAIRAGDAYLKASIDAGVVRRCSGRVEISEVPKDAEHPVAHVRRTLLLMEPAAPAPDAPPPVGATDEGAIEWQFTPLDPDEPIPTGSRVLVRESVIFPNLLREVQWRQRHAGGALTALPRALPERPIGPASHHHLGEVLWRVGDTPPGEIVHEYPIVAVRPGVFRVPWPDLLAGGTALPVRVDPPDLRMRIVEPQRPGDSSAGG